MEVPIDPLLDAAKKGHFPGDMKPQAAELDAVVDALLIDVLTEPVESRKFSVLHQLLNAPGVMPAHSPGYESTTYHFI